MSQQTIRELDAILAPQREELRTKAVAALAQLPGIAQEFRRQLEDDSAELSISRRDAVREECGATAIRAVEDAQNERHAVRVAREIAGNATALTGEAAETVRAFAEQSRNAVCTTNSLLARGEEVLHGPTDRFMGVVDDLELFILMAAPKLEDGGNFGVDVQATGGVRASPLHSRGPSCWCC
jgi:Proteasome activator PA28, C-terminal